MVLLLKIAVISDLHLGFRQYGSLEREQDFYTQFYKVCEEISKHNPNMVIIAGDLFNKPNPSPAAINAYREGIGSLKTDMICTIKGNHTMVLRDDHYSIDEFFAEDEFEGYYYLDDKSMTTNLHAMGSSYDNEFKKYINTNVQVDGITYRYNSSIDEFLEAQKELAAQTSGDYRILVVHQAFKEFCGFTGEELSIEDIDYSPYDVVICGHIHSRLDTKLSDGTWFVQPGSIERMNTVEALDEQKNGKGFYLIDTSSNEIEFYQVECDRRFFLGDVSVNSEEELQKHLQDLNEAIEKLEVPPIISYNYHNTIENIAWVREMIGRTKENILLNKSNIHDWGENDVTLEITDSEMPTVLEAIKMYGKESNLNDNQINLAIDIHNAINQDSENCSEILDNYYKKNRTPYEEPKGSDPELEELIEYFEK